MKDSSPVFFIPEADIKPEQKDILEFHFLEQPIYPDIPQMYIPEYAQQLHTYLNEQLSQKNRPELQEKLDFFTQNPDHLTNPTPDGISRLHFIEAHTREITPMTMNLILDSQEKLFKKYGKADYLRQRDQIVKLLGGLKWEADLSNLDDVGSTISSFAMAPELHLSIYKEKPDSYPKFLKVAKEKIGKERYQNLIKGWLMTPIDGNEHPQYQDFLKKNFSDDRLKTVEFFLENMHDIFPKPNNHDPTKLSKEQ